MKNPVEAWGAHGHPARLHKSRSTSSVVNDARRAEGARRPSYSHLSARQKATLEAMKRAKKHHHPRNQKTQDLEDQATAGRPHSPGDAEARPARGASKTRPATSDSTLSSEQQTSGSFWKMSKEPAKAVAFDPNALQETQPFSRMSTTSELGTSVGAFAGDEDDDADIHTLPEGGWRGSLRAKLSRMTGANKRGSDAMDFIPTTSTSYSVNPGQDMVTQIILSPKFDGFIGLVVVLNSITMALESEVDGDTGGVVLRIFDCIFLIVFTIELFLRAIALRWYLLQTFSDALDIVIVLAGWIQIVLQSFGSEDDKVLQSFQALKVFRALRALRMLRMFVFFDGLWLAVSSFFNCLWPLLWTCIFIAIILLIMSQFAVHLLGTSGTFEGICLDYGVGCKTNFELFGTTVRSMTTLFQIMTLDEWRAVVQPICDKHGMAYVFFGIHIGIASLALMNLVTAVVVENSMQKTLRNDEFQAIKKLQDAEEEKEEISALLEKIDLDNFNPRDLVKLKDTWRTLKLMFDAMQLSSEDDMDRLARAVDVNGDGDVSIAELLDFCLLMRRVSGDSIRMAFFQIMADGTDKWSALDRILEKEGAWISNSAIVAKLERYVRDCAHTGATPEPSPRNPVTVVVSPGSDCLSTPGDMIKSTKSQTPAALAISKMKSMSGDPSRNNGAREGGRSLSLGEVAKSMALGTKTTQLKRQKRFVATKSSHFGKVKTQPDLGSPLGRKARPLSREIASDNDLLQELRALRAVMQSQTREVEKQSNDIDKVQTSITDDVIAKMGVDARRSIASSGSEDVLPDYLPQRPAKNSMSNY